MSLQEELDLPSESIRSMIVAHPALLALHEKTVPTADPTAVTHNRSHSVAAAPAEGQMQQAYAHSTEATALSLQLQTTAVHGSTLQHDQNHQLHTRVRLCSSTKHWPSSTYRLLTAESRSGVKMKHAAAQTLITAIPELLTMPQGNQL